MGENQFRVRFEQEDGKGEIVNEKGVELTAREVADILNEQQATNDYLEESNSRLQIQLGETLRLVDEQQATIRKLQDLCGESDGENAKLRIENKRLQEENEQLRQSKEILQQEISDTQKILEMLSEKLKGWNDE